MRLTHPAVVASALASLGLAVAPSACSSILGIVDFTADGGVSADAKTDTTIPTDANGDAGEDGQGDDGGPDASTACTTPDASQCTGNAVQFCTSAGQWGPATDCDAQTCISGKCSGVCAPEAGQCVGLTPQTCAGDGGWGSAAACPEACSGGACVHFPSCQGGAAGAGNDCGPGSGGGSNNCCASLEVPGVPTGMTFYRSYDMVSTGDMTPNKPATVSGLRVDAYEVTVGRFRSFVSAVIGGWLPGANSGKHTHLNGGSGLSNAAAAGTYEQGWSASWNASLSSTTAMPPWDSNLVCDPTYATWTSSAGTKERRPINCVNWYEAYAFCIWDGGFLPSEAEWDYVAAGGTNQRVYPWSSPATSTAIDCNHANYTVQLDGGGGTPCVAGGTNNVGSESPTGDGRWGQSDLAGNVWEWNLDAFAAYVTPCTDCANLPSSTTMRVTRGGSFQAIPTAIITSYRSSPDPAGRDATIGFRCARAP